MQHHSDIATLPDWSAVPGNSAEARQLLNHRVAYFGGAMAALSLAFFAFNLLMAGLLYGAWLAFVHSAGDVLHLGAIGVFALLWLACRGGQRSASQLNWL